MQVFEMTRPQRRSPAPLAIPHDMTPEEERDDFGAHLGGTGAGERASERASDGGKGELLLDQACKNIDKPSRANRPAQPHEPGEAVLGRPLCAAS